MGGLTRTEIVHESILCAKALDPDVVWALTRTTQYACYDRGTPAANCGLNVCDWRDCLPFAIEKLPNHGIVRFS